MAEVEDAITDQGAPRGRLRVSAALAHGRLSIVPLVAAFSARYPAIVVELRLEDEVVDILGGQADVAIRFGQLADSPLTARLIGSIGEVIVASPDYLARHGTPQVPQDLLNHNCLRFNFRRAAPDWPFRVDGRDFSLQVSDDLASGDLVPLLEAYNPGDQEPIHAVFVGGAAMPARVRAFVDFLVEHHP
eukprot:gene22454-26647_t